jgi:hypothetical protein
LGGHYCPYNPNLVANDFHLFGPMKKHLDSKKLAIDADVKEGVTRLQTFNTSFLYNNI